ncbi:MAG: sigma-70 family RNA polymerase sigma factor [Ruminococcaceae bacterium]|nr:sigma-70 family RNA polymerase sigma factor [Oscillospiraceae bacterium]
MQENLTDNQLIELINSGEYKYLQFLINRYMPYIISVASRYNAGGLDTEDFIQEGVLAIFSAVKSFDSEKASFKTFVTLCIDRAMSTALSRATGAAKHIPDSLISPIDDVEVADTNSPESIIIEKENYDALANSIKKELSDFEYRILCEFLSGKSYADIAEALQVTVKSVDNALRRIRTKIKQ